MSLRQILHYFTGKPVILHLLPFHYFTHSILQYITENFPIHSFTLNHLRTLQKFSPPITLFFSTVNSPTNLVIDKDLTQWNNLYLTDFKNLFQFKNVNIQHLPDKICHFTL